MMNSMPGYALLTVLSLLSAACSDSTDTGGENPVAGAVTIRGTVAYRERIALPPGSVVTVSLNDVSLADVAATEIVSQSIVTAGEQVPVPFALGTDRASIRQGRSYTVRAEIRDSGDQLLWVTDTVHSIDAAFKGDVIDMGSLPLVRVTRSSPPADGADALAGSRWTIVAIAGESVPDDSRAAITFGAGGQLSGNASCNSFSGSYSLSGVDLTSSQLAVTMMACPGPLSELERRFLTILTGSSRISINAEGMLIISSTNGDSLMARRASDELTLAGSRWSVSRIDDLDVSDNSLASLLFGEDGRLSGNASCNTMSGAYQVNGSELTVGQLAVTRMACPDQVASLERNLLEVLNQPATISLNENGWLVITGPADRSIVARPIKAGSAEN